MSTRRLADRSLLGLRAKVTTSWLALLAVVASLTLVDRDGLQSENVQRIGDRCGRYALPIGATSGRAPASTLPAECVH